MRLTLPQKLAVRFCWMSLVAIVFCNFVLWPMALEERAEIGLRAYSGSLSSGPAGAELVETSETAKSCLEARYPKPEYYQSLGIRRLELADVAHREKIEEIELSRPSDIYRGRIPSPPKPAPRKAPAVAHVATP
jgi:hypothetical protein